PSNRLSQAAHPAGKMRGATSNLELPRLRFLIRVLGFANRASIAIRTPENLGLDAFFHANARAATKAALP
ncbi:MAG: hypothetical protein DME55_14495, partial [Verrucomicrobia bacterium]